MFEPVLPKQWHTYTELSAWHDRHKLCPACAEPSESSGYMLCSFHHTKWKELKVEHSGVVDYVRLVNDLMAGSTVLAKSPWIVDIGNLPE